MQKASKGDRGLARHQLNPPRQGDHLQLLTGAQAKLLAHPLRDDDLVLGGYGYEVHKTTVARNHDRSENGTHPRPLPPQANPPYSSNRDITCRTHWALGSLGLSW